MFLMLDNVYLQIFDFLRHKYLVIDVNRIYVHNDANKTE